MTVIEPVDLDDDEEDENLLTVSQLVAVELGNEDLDCEGVELIRLSANMREVTGGEKPVLGKLVKRSEAAA